MCCISKLKKLTLIVYFSLINIIVKEKARSNSHEIYEVYPLHFYKIISKTLMVKHCRFRHFKDNHITCVLHFHNSVY